MISNTQYQVKIYNRTNTTLKETISPSKMISLISLSANLDGWLWEQVLELNEPINSNKYWYWDIVKITTFNEKDKNWRTIYTWYVTKIWRKQTKTRQLIILTCLWVASLFTEQTTWITLTGLTCWQAIKNLVDSYNSNYWNVFNYVMWETIIDWPTIPNGSLSWKYLDNIKSLVVRSWFNFFVDWNATIRFKPTPITPTHYLTNQKDIEEIEIQEDLEWVINSATFTDEDFNTRSYQDDDSIALYWKKHYTWQSKSKWADYLESYVEKYVLERKDPKKETKIIVNRNYFLESIKPWDTVKVMNFELDLINNIKIVKLSYTPNKCVLNLEKYTSFGWEVINK